MFLSFGTYFSTSARKKEMPNHNEKPSCKSKEDIDLTKLNLHKGPKMVAVGFFFSSPDKQKEPLKSSKVRGHAIYACSIHKTTQPNRQRHNKWKEPVKHYTARSKKKGI